MAEADVKFTQIEELSPKGDKAANMEPTKRNDPQPSAQGNGPIAKLPYVKPGARLEKVFETTALACGKVFQTEGSCHYSRRTS